VRHLLRTAAAFLSKDFREASSYRVQFLLGVALIVTQLVFLAVFSDFFGPLLGERVGHRGSYFDFAILGLCMWRFLTAALFDLSKSIRTAQTVGTLEALLTTRTGIPTLVFCIPLYSFTRAFLTVLGYLVLGWTVFEVPFHPGSLLAASVVFVTAVGAFACLGVIGAGLTIAFKRTEVFNVVVSTASIFIGGVWFPTEAWPHWVQVLAEGLPITPALEGIRGTLLDGEGLRAVAGQVAHLLVFIAIALPVGALVFRWSLDRAKRDGTLAQY